MTMTTLTRFGGDAAHGGALPPPVAAAAKRALRAYGVATATLRPPPDFLLIGAKRGGTTSMFNYLLTHPDVLPLFPRPQKIKGAHFFDTGATRGAAWYRSHFPTAVARRLAERRRGRRVLVGEASPYYLFHPLAARRAATVVPHAKLVVLLRDPVERAYSHYKERVRHDAEPLSFEDALAAEPQRLAGEHDRLVADGAYTSYAHEQQSYLSQGLYLEPLREWLRHYPREQLLVLRSEDFYADPQRAYDEVLAFLGLAPHVLPTRKKWNYHRAEDLSTRTRAALQARVAEHNAELAAFLGMDLRWPGTQPRTA
jgi:hypothetical protein